MNKRKTALIGINNLTSVEQPAYSNHLQLFYRLGRSMPEIDFGICNPRRMSIDRMRNFAASAALQNDLDYLVFIDDDVLVETDCLQRLFARDLDICSGVTLIRGYPYAPMIFDLDKKEDAFIWDYKEKADASGLLTVPKMAVGFSLCVIKVDLLRKMTPPFFVTGVKFTEDVYFCQRALRQVPDVKIGADVNVETAHILGWEAIEPKNRDVRMMYDEARDPSIVSARPKSEKAPREDRGIEALKRFGILPEDIEALTFDEENPHE